MGEKLRILTIFFGFAPFKTEQTAGERALGDKDDRGGERKENSPLHHPIRLSPKYSHYINNWTGKIHRKMKKSQGTRLTDCDIIY